MEFGKTLREAREAKGYTIKQIAEMTHLMGQVVEGLENEDFSRIPAPIYGRGFVKLYCEAVGLEVKPMQNAFMAILNGETPPATAIPEIPPATRDTRRTVTTEPPEPEAISSDAAEPSPVPVTEPEPVPPPVPVSEPEPVPPPGSVQTSKPSPEPIPETPPPVEPDLFNQDLFAGRDDGFAAGPYVGRKTDADRPASANRSCKPQSDEPAAEPARSRYAPPTPKWEPAMPRIPWRIILVIAAAVLLVTLCVSAVKFVYRAATTVPGEEPPKNECISEPAANETPSAIPAAGKTDKPAGTAGMSADGKSAKTEKNAPAPAQVMPAIKRTPVKVAPLYFD